jgi:hypothetical protein
MPAAVLHAEVVLWPQPVQEPLKVVTALRQDDP